MHPIPVSERISILYLDRGVLEKSDHSLVITQNDRLTAIPVGKTAVLMLGPGVSVTHAAIKVCAEEGALLLWTGEQGVRLYAAGNPHSKLDSLLLQAGLRNDPAKHLRVARRIFEMMFDEPPPPRYSVEQLRGLEGSLVKKWYLTKASELGIEWAGKQFDLSAPVTRALAGCNAALYGIAEAVILALGYSPSIGFVHSGNARSFVFDLADTIKFKTVAPLAFELAAQYQDNLSEGIVRQACRDMFFRTKIATRLIDGLETVLNANRVD